MKTNLFDSISNSMIHYFVRPNGSFILNSLEKLNCDEYLYRLLRQEGYERILFINIEDTKCTVWAYDKLSYWASVKPEEFAAVDTGDAAAVARFLERAEGRETAAKPVLNTKYVKTPIKKAEARAVPAIGKCQLQTFSTEAEFRAFVANRLSPALTEKNIKSAVVIPMELFEKQGYMAEVTIDTLRRAERDNEDKKNIIVLTTTRRENLINCMNNPRLKDLHDWVPAVLSQASPGQDRVGVAIEKLTETGAIVLADSIGSDEIANLLLRKKLIENDERFAALPVSKMYHLAELLAEHCRMEQTHFQSFRSLRVNDHIRQLERRFDDDSVVEELVEKAAALHSRAPKYIGDLSSIYLERVVGQPVARFERTQQELMQEYNAAMSDLNELIGLESVKTDLESRMTTVRAYGGKNGPGHYIFSGNPGTGKTEVARLMGRIFKAMGLLKRGHLVECTKADLVAEHIGGSGPKTLKKCEEALDGVLFLDEAYNLVNTEPTGEKFSSKFDEEAYTELMKFMLDHKDRICVICAGYRDKMVKFRNANPGMPRRIPEDKIIDFPDYTAEELYRILALFASKDSEGFQLSDEFTKNIRSVIEGTVKNRSETFGNAGEMENLFQRCKACAAQRYFRSGDEATKYLLTAEDIPEDLFNRSSDSELSVAMASLNQLIGLDNVKEMLQGVLDTKQIYNDDQAPGHYIFAGNPGTGKTEVARKLGAIFKAMGLLRKGHVVECRVADLVAGAIGQSSIKTRQQCETALDGVLFVDEAYELVNTGPSGEIYASSFAEDAYLEIMTFMENNRHRICVIFAGYTDLMRKFVMANPGMSSRITDTIEFPDYSDDELLQILELMAKKDNFSFGEDFKPAALEAISARKRACIGNFANAREIRELLRLIKKNAAARMKRLQQEGQADTVLEQKYILCAEDARVGIEKEEAAAPQSEPQAPVWEYRCVPAGLFRELPVCCGEAVWGKRTQLIAATDSAILFVQTEKGYGTAFLISPDGYALTCDHVIRGCRDVRARFRQKGRAGGSDSWHPCTVINTKSDLDMALIKLEGEDFPYLDLAPVDRVIQKGEDFILSGYPFGKRTEKDLTTFNGYIASSESQEDEEGLACYNIDGEAKRGNSGSPIIALADGRVLGILTGSMMESGRDLTEEINRMRPIRYFWEEFTE